MTQECAQGSGIIDEDHNDYCDGWEEKNALTENLKSCIRSEFKYSTAAELNSLPYSALVSTSHYNIDYDDRLNNLGVPKDLQCKNKVFSLFVGGSVQRGWLRCSI